MSQCGKWFLFCFAFLRNPQLKSKKNQTRSEPQLSLVVPSKKARTGGQWLIPQYNTQRQELGLHSDFWFCPWQFGFSGTWSNHVAVKHSTSRLCPPLWHAFGCAVLLKGEQRGSRGGREAAGSPSNRSTVCNPIHRRCLALLYQTHSIHGPSLVPFQRVPSGPALFVGKNELLAGGMFPRRG